MSKGILVLSRPAMLFMFVLAMALGSIPIDLAAEETSSPYYSVETITLSDGKQLERITINGPPRPPPGYELERIPVTLPVPSQLTAFANPLPVPAYSWVFGCSAVSASMIAGYLDRSGLSNIYTGPTNGGIMPMDNSGWPTWFDGYAIYPSNPLTASRSGLDGRTELGSIDDYWVQSGSMEPDPYITGEWEQHAWTDAIGDYMKTSQSFYGNSDGSTTFWGYSSATRFTCSAMESGGYLNDGTLGRKQFYEARGYEVGDCYNQNTDNQAIGGFSFDDYKAKIDAGYPVFLSMVGVHPTSGAPVGHSTVGVGYDDSGSSTVVYLNDAWDNLSGVHSMDWDGTYSAYELWIRSVSIAEPIHPLAVDLARFEVWPEWPAIHVQWETTNEFDNLGFNLYRAEAGNEESTRIRLNQGLIPASAQTDSPFGAIYDWIDGNEVRKNRTYLYWLEDVDIYGATMMHGPVSVLVADGYWSQVYLPLVSK